MTTALETAQTQWLRAEGGRPALVVVDVQRDFADPERLGDYGLTPEASTALAAAVARIAELVDAARRSKIPVVWVELGSDPAEPWRASRWLRSGNTAPLDDEPCVVGTDGAEWFGAVPVAGERRIVKRGYSGFVGTDLAAHLRAENVGWVTVCGLTTECCVAATAQDAMQEDWPVVVPSDATAAYEIALHEAALTTIALNVAVVMPSEQVTHLWTEPRP
ncbi:cysteine hydrolase family protein [Microbacterium trichothecenolyticum]|uniref:Nicotinamidase-related amidase n=1 Tax=Microbacterium trichothecenolyticum TaxID=69370 RepID=A0ABU0TPA2_MICTR|nr:isochorismatase family cysteine hydrolase [Microbacterium trichothecenolyticum]MDQ1121496.1 nicotinamidase-related amidase [Microbacterium trichothecenolyticum]